MNLSDTPEYLSVISLLEWLDREVKLDPEEFARDFLASVEDNLRHVRDAVSDGTI